MVPEIVMDAPQDTVMPKLVAPPAFLLQVSELSGLVVPPQEKETGCGGLPVDVEPPEFAELPEPEPEELPDALPDPPGFLRSGRIVRIEPEGLLPSSETCFLPRFTKTPWPG